jgi:hypothetical protein
MISPTAAVLLRAISLPNHATVVAVILTAASIPPPMLKPDAIALTARLCFSRTDYLAATWRDRDRRMWRRTRAQMAGAGGAAAHRGGGRTMPMSVGPLPQEQVAGRVS